MSDDLTPERLEELERLARAATPGPRRVAHIAQVRGSRRFTVPSRREYEVVLAHVPGVGVVLVEPPGGQAPSADAQLMAALDRETVSALIARAQERDRLAAEVDRLLQALRNIRLAAARGRTFGHQATLQPHVRMAARKDEALEHVLQFCAQLGVEGSLLRKANAALAEAPTLCQSPDCQMSGPHELTECCPGGEHLIGGPAEAPTPAREEPQHRHCPTCRHHTLDDMGDRWCALGISTAGRVPGLVTHLQPFGCSLHEGKETSDDE